MWSKLFTRAVTLKHGVRNMTGPSVKLLRGFEKFQREDGVPVYLKGGAMDRILVGLTTALICVGIADGGYTLFKMARPKKK